MRANDCDYGDDGGDRWLLRAKIMLAVADDQLACASRQLEQAGENVTAAMLATLLRVRQQLVDLRWELP